MAKNKLVGQIDIVMTSKGVKMVAKDLDKVSKSSKKVEKQQDKTTQSTKKAGKQIDKFDKQNKSLYQNNLSSAKGFSKMNQTIGGEGGSSGLVAAYATLAANVFAATAAFNALRQASQVEQLVQGLEALGRSSGKNLEIMADGFREAAGFAVSYDQALRAISVGASASFNQDQITGLAEVAKSAAIALGRDVGDAVDRLTRGAAKLEPEILDELGIFVRLDDASEKYAASLGVAATELTRFQQRQAFANEILEQGRRKFGEVGEEVGTSPFDRLAASLADLARNVMNFFNTVLGPLAGFLAENTMALAGFFAIITKGIITQALPALNRFAAKSAETAGEQLRLADASIRRTEKEIKAQRAKLKPLKVVRGAYQDLFGKIKQGTATTEELNLANKKLLRTIQIRQKNIDAGGLKNLNTKKQELALIRQEQIELQKLINLEGQRTAKAGQALALRSSGQFSRIEGGVLGQLDKDFDQGNFLGGMNKAFKKSNKATFAYINRIKRAGVETQIFGRTIPFLSKGLAIGGAAFKSFGLTAKIAIKGIFTAIPIIGQLLLVIDLLIIGLKKLVGWIAGAIPEASELSKATKALAEQTKFYEEVQSRANLANKEAKDLLLISANATQQLIDATDRSAEAQKQANKESTIFGKFLKIIQRDIEVVGMKIGIAFAPIGDMFKKLVLTMSNALIDFQLSAEGFINFIIDGMNLWADEGEKIEYIDTVALRAQKEQIKNELEEIEKEAEKRLNWSTLDTFGDLAATSDELKSLQAVFESSGAASRELADFFGTDNINTFAEQLKEFKATGDESSFTNEALRNSLRGLLLETDANGVAIGNLSAEMFEGTNLIELFSKVLEKGTQNTRLSGQAVDELAQTFTNSGQKLNEFFNSFKKQAQVGPIVSELDNMTKIINNIVKGEGGEVALFQSFETAPASLKRVLDNTQEIADLQEYINGLDKESEMGKILIEKAEAKLGRLRKSAFEELARITKELQKQQLFDEAKIKALKQQENAVKKGAKANEAGTAAQIRLSNQQNQITLDRLNNELILQEDNLTLASKKLIEEGKIDELSKEQLEVYAKITDTKQLISETNEKLIGEEEKSALVAQQKLEITKMQQAALIAEANAQLKITRNLNAQINAQKGLGRKQTPRQQLEAKKAAAKIAVDQAQNELDNLKEKFKLEKLILEARLLAADVDRTTIDEILLGLDKQLEYQERIANAKVKGAQADLGNIGADKFEGLQSETVGGKMIGAIDESIGDLGALGDDATTQDTLEAMSDALKPMRDQLMALGPEGEFVAIAQQGLLTMASSFDILADKGASSADKLAAVGSAIGAMGAIMAAQSKAQIAEIDNQIKAEQSRDGKSKESLAKIKALEKKKDEMARKAFERNKKMQMAQTVVNTAASITKALTEAPFPMSLALAVMYGAMGMAQLAIIKKQKYQSSISDVPKPTTNLNIGKAGNAVDVSKGTTAGELQYLRGGRITGQDIGGAGGMPGGAMGRRGYANGGEGIVVGERGPEVVTPASPVDITPNYALAGAGANVNFTINAVDAAGVEDVLMNQRGNIIRMIRDAANENGELFLEDIDTQAYGSRT